MTSSTRRFPSLTALAVALILQGTPSAAAAHEYFVPGFTVIHPWADATLPDAQSAPVYFKLESVRVDDRLLRAESPYAESVELRAGDDPSTPALSAIEITPADSIDFGVGRPHLLLRGLKAPLQWGRSYLMLMVFERAGFVQVMVSIGAH